MTSQDIEITIGAMDIDVQVGDNIEVTTIGPTIEVQLNN